MRIALTGFMGTGKTAVGRRLAARLGRPFLDSDAMVAERAGKSVPEIFAEDGEARFRELEREAIAEACRRGDVVLATGGGALLDERNLDALVDGGLVVRLDADAETIARRVGRYVEQRPLLQGGPLVERIRGLLAQREAAYARVALRIDTSGRTIDDVAEQVIGEHDRAGREYAPRRPAAPAGRP